MTDPDPRIVACHRWPTNGHLLADVERLHFRPGDRLLDVTYGRGAWWTRTTKKPDQADDLRSTGVDFRDLPYLARSYHVVAFDPAYVVVGGRTTSTIDPDFHDRFGMHTSETYSPEVHHRTVILPGLLESIRVSRRLVLVKAMNYTSSGDLYLGTVRIVEDAERAGCKVIDWFDMIGRPSRQPKVTTCRTCSGNGVWPQDDGSVETCSICSGTGSKPRVQRRAARNSSTLLVLRRPR